MEFKNGWTRKCCMTSDLTSELVKTTIAQTNVQTVIVMLDHKLLF